MKKKKGKKETRIDQYSLRCAISRLSVFVHRIFSAVWPPKLITSIKIFLKLQGIAESSFTRKEKKMKKEKKQDTNTNQNIVHYKYSSLLLVRS